MTKKRVLSFLLALASAAALGGLASAGSAPEARQSATLAVDSSRARGSAGVDPRAGGFEIGLGEWALVPEARSIRPGRVTFVIRNRGKLSHGFEIEIRRRGDRHGGHDDDAESIELRPGQATRMTLDLTPGVYEIECFVSDHDDMGMRGLLEVRDDAPLVAPRRTPGPATVEIVGFAFEPATLRTTPGVVTWRNADAAPHTATGKQFSSPELRRGASFSRRFMRAGTYAYLCALHPGMRGKVVVARGSTG